MQVLFSLYPSCNSAGYSIFSNPFQYVFHIVIHICGIERYFGTSGRIGLYLGIPINSCPKIGLATNRAHRIWVNKTLPAFDNLTDKG